MKKVLVIALVLLVSVMLFAQGAGETKSAAKTKIYVLGPTPDHGWTAQAGSYAQQKCEEITKAGKYTAVYMAASSGEEQVDHCNTIVANDDAIGVVMFALEDSAAAGQEALYAAGIPFISFDRFIESTMDYAILNYSGNNWQCGAGIAYWLQQNGMKPGDTVVVLYGDNGTVCKYREEGFRQFLKGELDYSDKALGKSFHTTEIWTDAELDAVFNTYSVVCNWSADGAYAYLEQKLEEIAGKAQGSLYIYSMDDEMTFGMLNLLEGSALSDSAKKKLESLNIAISAIGGMQELYNVMNGSSTQTAVAEKYFDNMMSVYFSPSMMKSCIDKMLDYLGGNWSYNNGDVDTEPVWIVDRQNVNQYEGFLGH